MAENNKAYEEAEERRFQKRNTLNLGFNLLRRLDEVFKRTDFNIDGLGINFRGSNKLDCLITLAQSIIHGEHTSMLREFDKVKPGWRERVGNRYFP